MSEHVETVGVQVDVKRCAYSKRCLYQYERACTECSRLTQSLAELSAENKRLRKDARWQRRSIGRLRAENKKLCERLSARN